MAQTSPRLQTSLRFSLLLIMLVISACAAVPRKQKAGDYLVIRTRPGDAAVSLAETFGNDPLQADHIRAFNQVTTVPPGQDIVIPRIPTQPGGITAGSLQNIPALCYSGFSEKEFQGKGTAEIMSFEQQLVYLNENGFQPLPLSRLLPFKRLVYQPPRKAVLLLFDTTEQGFYRHIFPILQQHGFSAVLIIDPERVEKNKAVTWRQVMELSDAGVAIGCRVPDRMYRFLSNETFYQYFQTLRASVRKASRKVEEQLGRPCRFFMYPPGPHAALLVSILKKEKFRGAFVVQPGANPFYADPFTIHLTQCTYRQSHPKFIQRLKVVQP